MAGSRSRIRNFPSSTLSTATLPFYTPHPQVFIKSIQPSNTQNTLVLTCTLGLGSSRYFRLKTGGGGGWAGPVRAPRAPERAPGSARPAPARPSRPHLWCASSRSSPCPRLTPVRAPGRTPPPPAPRERVPASPRPHPPRARPRPQSPVPCPHPHSRAPSAPPFPGAPLLHPFPNPTPARAPAVSAHRQSGGPVAGPGARSGGRAGARARGRVAGPR